MKKFINPFTVAFVLGAVFLTVLPFMQRRFLKAPPPLGAMGPWALTHIDTGVTVSAESMREHVVLATLAPDACEADCRERVAGLEQALEHTDDLKDAIQLVVLARPGAVPALKGRSKPRLAVLSGDVNDVERPLTALRAAWATFAGTDAGTTMAEFASLPAFIVIDQQGNVRGFWRDDAAGRGNSINAARLLAKYGVNP